MIRVVLYFLGLALLAIGFAWLADRPGTLVIEWQDYHVRTSVFWAVVALIVAVGALWVAWTVVRNLLLSPVSMTRFFSRRRRQQGLEALTSGMIAAGSGDRALAARYALQASRSLPNEPLTDLLRAQTAELAGDRRTAKRIYEAMLQAPETELLGLRGLFLEAQRQGDTAASRQLVERAVRRNAKVPWAAAALFDLQCKQGDWAGALETLAGQRRSDQLDRKEGDRRRAVLLTAQAVAAEESGRESEVDKALTLALEAHDLAPDLVPAAELAGRLLASRGKMQKAASVLEQAWRKSPHPDLAYVYAYARTGDSPRDRLLRVRKLAQMMPHSRESPIAVANAAIEAREWAEARAALQPLLDDQLSQRVCVLMARIEGADKGDAGRVREWLARAVQAPRDPAWTADGHVSERWAPVSPVTGRLDAYEWSVAEDRASDRDGASRLLQELSALGAPPAADRMLEAGAARPGAEVALVEVEPSEPQGPRSAPAARPARIDVEAESGPAATTASEVDVTVSARKGEGQRAERQAEPQAAATGRPGRGEAAPGPVEVPAPAAARRPPAPTGEKPREPIVTRVEPAEVEFFVPPHAPDDPGPEDKPVERAVARTR